MKIENSDFEIELEKGNDGLLYRKRASRQELIERHKHIVEFAKTIDPKMAAELEEIYRTYDDLEPDDPYSENAFGF